MKLDELASDAGRAMRDAASNAEPPALATEGTWKPPRRNGVRVAAVGFVAAAVVGGAVVVLSLDDDTDTDTADPMVVTSPTTEQGSSTPSAEVTRPPVVTELQVDVPVALRVVAMRHDDLSLAVLDLEAGTTTVYPTSAHAVPRGPGSGAVMTPGREAVIWTSETAQLFEGSLADVDLVLAPSQPRDVEGLAFVARIVPTPDGERAWLVQKGIAYGTDRMPTVAELFDLDNGRRLGRFEADGSATPVAASDTGLVLNTERLVDTGDGWTTDPGSERVVHLLEDGSVVEVGNGRAIAASTDTIARMTCSESGPPTCDLYRDNQLVFSDLDGSDPRIAVPPADGTWLDLGGPSVPSHAMPVQTVSPDGSKLLIAHAPTLDVNGGPEGASLQLVDLETGTSTTVADDAGRPAATWSADGRWIALLDEPDIRLVDATDFATTMTLSDVIPPGHYALAAG